MMHILIPGQPCPPWLERIEFSGGVNPTHRIAALSVVTVANHDGRRVYRWRPVLPSGLPLLVVNGGGGSVTITGQAPDNDGAPVIMDPQPVIGWPILAMVTAACGFVLGNN